MIAAFAVLLVCQLVGETATRALGLPLPGPVLGMMLLFAALVWRGRGGALEPPAALSSVSGVLIGNLSLLLIPAAVGIVQQGALLSRYGLIIAVTIVSSTLLTLMVTALVFRAVARVGR